MRSQEAPTRQVAPKVPKPPPLENVERCAEARPREVVLSFHQRKQVAEGVVYDVQGVLVDCCLSDSVRPAEIREATPATESDLEKVKVGIASGRDLGVDAPDEENKLIDDLRDLKKQLHAIQIGSDAWKEEQHPRCNRSFGHSVFTFLVRRARPAAIGAVERLSSIPGWQRP